MITLSQLVCKARGINPQKGKKRGYCVFCGQKTKHGHQPKFGAKFTAYPYLQGGEVACPTCWHMYKEQEYRTSMWYVTEKEWVKFKRLDGAELLLDPPEPPFSIYYTQTWKKQGWITLMNKVNYDNSQFIVGLDYDTILADPKKAEDYLNLIQELRRKRVSKTELETGNLKPHNFEKIGEDLNILHKLKMVSEDPLWRLCVFLHK